MKKELTGYVTGMINVLRANGGDTDNLGLDNLLDYIIDMKEESTDVAEDKARYISRIQGLKTENIKIRNEDGILKIELQELKSKLAETEESLQNMLDNESRLNKRVEKSETLTNVWTKTALEVIEENGKLREQLTKLKGPQWMED